MRITECSHIFGVNDRNNADNVIKDIHTMFVHIKRLSPQCLVDAQIGTSQCYLYGAHGALNCHLYSAQRALL